MNQICQYPVEEKRLCIYSGFIKLRQTGYAGVGPEKGETNARYLRIARKRK